MRKSQISCLLLCGVLSLVLVFSGCLGPSHASRCDSVAAADKDACLHETATWYQEPETCYGISDLGVRAVCLNDSVDPDAAQRLIATSQALGQSPPIEDTTPSINNTPVMPTVNSSAAPASPTAAGNIASCIAGGTMSNDSCAQAVAIDLNDISICASIPAGDVHTHCIFAISSSQKDPTICTVLSGNDRQLCSYYSKGG